MLLKNGEKIFVVTRRSFEKDLRRHFIGEVQACTDFAVRINGYAFVYEEFNGSFVKRDGIRTRIISLTDAGETINVIPAETHLEDVKYVVDERNHRIITDGGSFRMDVSEFSSRL